ncbi:MAG: hypothetical protein RR619_03170, partial [Raoultibacter sp.]
MHQDEPIIINPVEHSRSTDKQKPSQSKYFTYTNGVEQAGYAAPATVAGPHGRISQTGQSFQAATPQEPTPTPAQTIPSQQQEQPKSRFSGIAQIVGGGACALVGIPMLLLPGPGLIAIGGGIARM